MRYFRRIESLMKFQSLGMSAEESAAWKAYLHDEGSDNASLERLEESVRAFEVQFPRGIRTISLHCLP